MSDGNKPLDIGGRFKALMRREPTAEEINEFYKTAKDVEISTDDALWNVILVMRRERELTVNGIAEAVRLAESKASEIEARVEANATTNATKNATAKLADAAPAVAQKAVTTRFLQWLTAAVVVLVLVFTGGAWYFYNAGIERGRMQSNAATAWAGTAQGQLAYRLWQAGDLERLAKCDKPGWYKETQKGVTTCYADKPDSKNMIYGWSLPK